MDPILIADFLKAVDGQAVGPLDETATFNQLRIDSRKIEPGELFWALQGENQNGEDFVRDAHQRGAALSVVMSDRRDWDGPVVKVQDTQAALLEFAKWYREQHETFLIGVTGSVGKTTTREMIHSVLAEEHRGIQTIGNFNNEIGLPLSLLQLQRGDEFGVLEMGACRRGDILKLCRVAQPEVGVITSIAPAHIEKFGGIEEIIRTKAELFDSLPEQGFAVINGDCPHAGTVAAHADCPVIFVGESSKNDFRAREIEVGQNELRFSVEGKTYRVAANGRHLLPAALSAVAVGREIGMTPSAIAAGLRNFQPPQGRCQIRQVGSWTIIDDSYNANPASMRAACELMKAWQTRHKKIAILGDMLELGAAAAQYHRELGATIAQSGIDSVLAYGEFAGDVVTGARVAGMDVHQIAQCPTWDTVLMTLECWLEPHDLLLIKGSRSMRMERVIDWAQQQSPAVELERLEKVPA